MVHSTDASETASLRAEIITAASKYLDAIVSHDPSEVPLAEHAWRIEQGLRDASGAFGKPIGRYLKSRFCTR